MAISTTTYQTAAAACVARINLEMERHNLKPSDIQKVTSAWVLEGKETHAITMQDLYQYRKGVALPKRGKLEVLAKVLQCHPTELVPPHLQTKRASVRRAIHDVADRANNRDIHVEPEPGDPMYAELRVRVTLPIAEATKIAGILNKRHYITDARRRGMSEEWIKQTFDPDPAPQMPPPGADS